MQSINEIITEARKACEHRAGNDDWIDCVSEKIVELSPNDDIADQAIATNNRRIFGALGVI